MYSKTNKEFLFYKLNNKYFKIPTYGFIFKIIDFGRCIFTFKNNIYMNDNFSNHGEAQGQYYYPKLYNNTNKLTINYNFDLCRLATTIYDELLKLNIECGTLKNLILFMLKDKNNNLIYDGLEEPDFQLYIDITKKAINCLPHTILNHDIFKKYRIQKKNCNLINTYKLN